MPRIRWMTGAEKHDFTWARFEVTGLETYQEAADHKKPVPSGFSYYEADVPVGTIFTVDEAAGDLNGTDEARFAVCRVTGGRLRRMEASQCDGFCVGIYEALVEADGVAKAARLKHAWGERGEGEGVMEWVKEWGSK